MHVVAPEWTEGRLDDLNGKVDRGFDKIDRRFEKVDQRLERIDGRLDALQRTMVQGVIAMTAAILAGFGGLIVLIATQL